MVMEAVPTPDVVGREFVRQYYTLLNQAPAHAHRFYNSNSFFVHGTMTKPAIGQRQIHQKIQQLNFRDCHAKISQVDSQATLGNGLVVQVSGELSNDGEPMRRFTQTFVLGTQSPKKYYVHNDIFRYQDMLLSDEEGDSPEETDVEVQPQVQDSQVPQKGGNGATGLEYFNTGSGLSGLPVDSAPPPPGHSVNGGLHEDSGHVHGGGDSTMLPSQPAAVVNGSVMSELDLMVVNQQQAPQAPPQNQQAPSPQLSRSSGGKGLEDSQELEAPLTDEEPYQPESIQEQLHITEVANEPMTFANLFKTSPLMGAGGATRSIMSQQPAPHMYQSVTAVTQEPPQRAITKGPGGVPGTGTGGPMPPRGPPPRGPLGRAPRAPGGAPPPTDRGERGLERSEGSVDGERRRAPSQYTDEHQIFMGHLPLDATEAELRTLFSKFGTIVDLRIHSKQSSNVKGTMGGRVPNYGFVIFEDPQSVKDVLNCKAICFPDESGVKLNVEEKKAKHRTSAPPQGGPGGQGGPESNWTIGRGPGPRGVGGNSAPPRGGPGPRGSAQRPYQRDTRDSRDNTREPREPRETREPREARDSTQPRSNAQRPNFSSRR